MELKKKSKSSDQIFLQNHLRKNENFRINENFRKNFCPKTIPDPRAFTSQKIVEIVPAIYVAIRIGQTDTHVNLLYRLEIVGVSCLDS